MGSPEMWEQHLVSLDMGLGQCGSGYDPLRWAGFSLPEPRAGRRSRYGKDRSSQKAPIGAFIQTSSSNDIQKHLFLDMSLKVCSSFTNIVISIGYKGKAYVIERAELCLDADSGDERARSWAPPQSTQTLCRGVIKYFWWNDHSHCQSTNNVTSGEHRVNRRKEHG
jgi:hypothetical protein